MKKRPTRPESDDMLPEYDFRGGVRGKYAKRLSRCANFVVLDPDVAKHFPDADELNDFLRTVIRIGTRRRQSR